MDIDLFAHRSNDFSEHGEDGIIARILELEGLDRGIFVEFGAWDGMRYSNTRRLYRDGWAGCYIEGDPGRYRDLCRNVPDRRVTKVQAYVAVSGEHSLDRILEREGIDRCDLLSIDIDGDDLAVWKSVTGIAPRVVVIEYNPTIPFDTFYLNPPGRNHGNSARAISEFAIGRGYTLVEATATNLILVDSSASCLAHLERKSLTRLRDQVDPPRYFFGYDGTLLVSGAESPSEREILGVPWARFGYCVFPQPLPRGLRRYAAPLWLECARVLYASVSTFLLRPVQYSIRVWRVLTGRRGQRPAG